MARVVLEASDQADRVRGTPLGCVGVWLLRSSCQQHDRVHLRGTAQAANLGGRNVSEALEAERRRVYAEACREEDAGHYAIAAKLYERADDLLLICIEEDT